MTRICLLTATLTTALLSAQASAAPPASVSSPIGATPGRALPSQSPNADYTAIGPGHYILAMAENGRFVTLEDRSRWEIAAPSRFRSAGWKPDDGIIVRRGEAKSDFNYELENVERDEIVVARYLN